MRHPTLALALLLVLLQATPAPGRAAAPAPSPWGDLELRGQSVAPGGKRKLSACAERSFECGFLDFPIFVARGAKTGPALCVTAGIHGDELNSVEIARRVFAAVDARSLSGTLIVLPAINSMGLRTADRYLPDRRDLNRAFPGSPRGSVASILADVVFTLLKAHCNDLVDLHTASDFRSNYPQIRADLANGPALELARAFGVGVIIGGAGPAGSLRREAMDAGIPAIIYEAGPPYIFREDEITKGVEGLRNLLDHLGMFESEGHPAPTKVLRKSYWVRAPRGQGGFFFPKVSQGDSVKAGQLLGTITDPGTDEVHELRAKADGTIVGMALPRVVLSGYGLFHVGELADQ
jgi:predicted deacylase